MSWFWDDDYEDVVSVKLGTPTRALTADEARRATEVEAKKRLAAMLNAFNKKIDSEIRRGHFSAFFNETDWNFNKDHKTYAIEYFTNLGYTIQQEVAPDLNSLLKGDADGMPSRPYILIKWDSPDIDFNKGKL